MGEFLLYFLGTIAGGIFLYSFRKMKPIVKCDALILKLPLVAKIFILIIFSSFFIMLLGIIWEKEYLLIPFPIFFIFIFHYIFLQISQEMAITTETVTHRNFLFKKRTFFWKDHEKIDFHTAEERQNSVMACLAVYIFTTFCYLNMKI